MIIESKYQNIIIPNPTKAVFLVRDFEGNTQVLNEEGKEIFTEYENVQAIEINGATTSLPYEKSVLAYEENGKIGLIDFTGKVVAKPIYEEVASVKYKEGEILAKKDGKYGVINNKGIELIPFEYDEIEADKYYKDNGYSKSGYIVRKTTEEGYRYGYINSNWNKLLDTEYSSISRILDIEKEDIYLIVAKDGRYGLIKNKNVEIDFSYQSIEYNGDTNLLAIQRGEQYGVLDLTGRTIINIEYKSIQFNGIYILAKSYTEDIYFNQKGEKVENSYISMTEVQEEKVYITINEDSLYGLTNTKGENIVPNEYLYIEYAFDTYFIAYKEGKGLGVIDKDGNTAKEFEYDTLSRVGENKLLKGIDIKKGTTCIISEEMKEIVSLENAIVEEQDEYIEIYNDKSIKYIARNGELKTAKDILSNNKIYAVYKNNKWGFENKSGNIIVEPEYDYVTELNMYGFAGIRKNDKWGVIDENGKVIYECNFEFETEEDMAKPEFIGKYYKTYTENGEIYYTDKN